jgi:hypothetical protein
MRFQKGVKNFKITTPTSKDHPNNLNSPYFDDFMFKNINPIRSRKNSTDYINQYNYHNNNNNNNSDRITVVNNQLATFFYGQNQNHNSSSNKRPHSSNNNNNTSNLKRSSSYDNVYYQVSSNRPSTSNTNQHFYPKHVNFDKNAYNNSQYYYTNTSNNQPQNNQVHNNKIYFKDLLTENQKTIQEINKEALKEFQSLIKNEIVNKKHNQQQQHPQNSELSASAEIADILDKKNIDQKEDEQEEEVISEKDSLDTDSLLDSRTNSPEPIIVKSVANKIDYEKDGPTINIYNKPTSSNKISNPVPSTIEQKDLTNNELFLSKRAEFNTYSDPLAALINNMNNINLLKQQQQKQNNSTAIIDNSTTPVVKNRVAGSSSVHDLHRLTNNDQNQDKNLKQVVKSILKRSSSFDNGINTTGLIISNDLNIGNNANKFTVKDSIELTNNRINSGSTTNSEARKKSVRFASNLQSTNTAQIDSITKKKDDINQVILDSRISSANSIRRPVVKPRTNSNLVNHTSYSPSLIANKNPNEENLKPQSNNVKINDENDEKPPVYPNVQLNGTGGAGVGYSLLNLKRKELIQNNRAKNSPTSFNCPKTNSFLNSPKNMNLNSTTPSPTGLNLNFMNHVNSRPSSSTANQNLNTPNSNMNQTTPNVVKQTDNNSNNHRSAFVFNEKYRIQYAEPTTPSSYDQEHIQFINMNNNHQTTQQQQLNLTRIPLSPKSNLKSNYSYFVPHSKQYSSSSSSSQAQLTELENNTSIIKKKSRPFSAGVPNATNINLPNYIPQQQQNQNQIIMNHHNPNSNANYRQNNLNDYQSHPLVNITPQHRIVSADSLHQKNPT